MPPGILHLMLVCAAWSFGRARLGFEHFRVGHDFTGDVANSLVLIHRQLAQEFVGSLFAETLLFHQETFGALDGLALDQRQPGAIEFFAHGNID